MVLPRVATPSAGVKTLHPAGHEGVADVYATFQANDDAELKLALYTRQDAHQPEDVEVFTRVIFDICNNRPATRAGAP